MLLKREIGRERERKREIESKKVEGLRENIGQALQLEKRRERERRVRRRTRLMCIGRKGRSATGQ